MFLPTRVIVNKRKKESLASLLGCYLFVQFDPQCDRWRPICSTFGVRKLFSTTPEHPTPIPDAVINRMLEPEQQPPPARYTVVPGQTVRIVNGPFASFQGVVSSVDRKSVHVFIDLFGRSLTNLELNYNDVEYL